MATNTHPRTDARRDIERRSKERRRQENLEYNRRKWATDPRRREVRRECEWEFNRRKKLDSFTHQLENAMKKFARKVEAGEALKSQESVVEAARKKAKGMSGAQLLRAFESTIDALKRAVMEAAGLLRDARDRGMEDDLIGAIPNDLANTIRKVADGQLLAGCVERWLGSDTLSRVAARPVEEQARLLKMSNAEVRAIVGQPKAERQLRNPPSINFSRYRSVPEAARYAVEAIESDKNHARLAREIVRRLVKRYGRDELMGGGK